MSGKFICIEGPDGSGKEAQSDRLVAKLSENGFKVKFFDFPQYQDTFFGEMVGKMLSGDYGPMEAVNPYLASLPYALDRWQVSKQIREVINNGDVAVANRFTLSNLAYQSARLPNDKRKEFVDFILKLENQILEIPTPHLYIHLDVPSEISSKLILGRLQKKYLRDGKVDELEKNYELQVEAARMYRRLSGSIKNVVRINCCDIGGGLMSIGDVHKLVWEKVAEYLPKNIEGQLKGKER